MSAEPLALILRYVRQLADAEALTALPDGPLLARYASTGEEAAFAVFVERYGGLVLGVCRRLLLSEADAEDVFQATFLILARRARSLDKSGPLGGYLHTIAYRLALKLRTEQGRRRVQERQAARVATITPAEETEVEELRPILDEELQRLPAGYRLPLVLCYLQGKTNAQAAAELGWPSGSMSRRLTRARELLRSGLARRGVGLPAALLGVAAAGTAEAAVSTALLAAATRAAVVFGERGGRAAEGSAGAWVLARAYLQGVVMTRLKAAAALILLAGIVAGGALARRTSEDAKERKSPPAPVASDRSAAAAPKPAPEAPSVLGTWRVVSLRIEGQQAPEDLVKQLRVTLTKKEITIKPRLIGQRDDRGKWSLRIEGPDGETWPYRLGKDGAGTTLAYTWKHEAAGTGVTTYHYRFVKGRLELCQDRPLELFSGKEGMMWALERLPEKGGKPEKSIRLPWIKLLEKVGKEYGSSKEGSITGIGEHPE